MQSTFSQLVSIVIPSTGRLKSEDGSSFLVDAVQSIIEKSTYPLVEIVVVLDQGASPQVVQYLKADRRYKTKIVEFKDEFNFSSKCNVGFAASSGEFALFLNDDTLVVSPKWIEAMLATASLTEVGFVGAKLLFEDGTIQHAGHSYQAGGPGHLGFGRENGKDPQYEIGQYVAGVTAACSMIHRQKFLQIGGFSELFPSNYNDVDACLKAQAVGLKNYYEPEAVLFHFESKSREPRIQSYESALLQKRWGRFF